MDVLLKKEVNPNLHRIDAPSVLEIVASFRGWVRFWEYQQTAEHINKSLENFVRNASTLLKAGANPNVDEGLIVYHFFAEWPEVSFHELLNAGVDPNIKISTKNKTIFGKIFNFVNDPDAGGCFPNYLTRIEDLLKLSANPKLVFPSGYPRFYCDDLETLIKKYGY